MGIPLYVRAHNRLEVNQWGIVVAHGHRSRSILWDQLNDVTVEVAEGSEGDIRYLVQLVLHTPTGTIRSRAAIGMNTTRGRMHQLAATIRNYRDHIRAGTATWLSTADDEASTH